MHSPSYVPPLIVPWEVWGPLAAAGILLILSYALARLRPEKAELSLQLALGGGLAIVGATVASLFSVIPTFLEFYAPVIFASAWIAPFSGLAGLSLFLLRRKRLDIYGMIEICAAVVAIGVCAFNAGGSASQRAVALLTATYFLVRGLDNADKGKLLHSIKRWFRHSETLTRILKQRRRPRAGYATVAFFVIGIVGIFVLPRPDNAVPPPYMSNKDGTRLPLSPVHCGDLFVVCDEAAWRARDHLIHGSEAERRKAEQKATDRFNDLERQRSEIRRDLWRRISE